MLINTSELFLHCYEYLSNECQWNHSCNFVLYLAFDDTMATTEQVSSLTRDNLYLVFGEKDVGKRLENLSRLYAPSALFIDDSNILRTHEEISKLVSTLQERM